MVIISPLFHAKEAHMGAKLLALMTLTACCTLMASGALAAEGTQPATTPPPQVKEQSTKEVKTQKKERAYGSQLMTKEEQTEYQARMRAAKTPEERKQIRKEHHEKMKAKAAERSVTLPDQPPARGMGKGMGAASQGQTTQDMKGGAKDRVYGSQLMTKEERAEYRAKRQTAKTPEEREKIRKEHHEKMKARAAERGVTLPDEPPAPGMGKGMGPGGGGMGPGPAGR
jgi:hypothetical protein